MVLHDLLLELISVECLTNNEVLVKMMDSKYCYAKHSITQGLGRLCSKGLLGKFGDGIEKYSKNINYVYFITVKGKNHLKREKKVIEY